MPRRSSPFRSSLPAPALRSGRLHSVVWTVLALALLALSGVFAPAAVAQERPDRPERPERPAAVPSRSVTLTMTKARHIDLPADVRDVLVADPDVANIVVKTPRLVYLIGVKVGATNAYFMDAEGRQILKLDIKVEMDLTAVRDAVGLLVPGADVQLHSINDNIVLTGSVPSAAVAEDVRQIAIRFTGGKAENVINMLRVSGGQQVVIAVRVAEMRRDVAKSLGVNLFLQDTKSATSNASLRRGDAAAVPALGAGMLALNALPFYGLDRLNATLEALETDGQIKTLAEPNLTALSGETAKFLAGGEFPVVTPPVVAGGAGSTTFKPFGVRLEFTPVVLNSGRISMRIMTEVSDRAVFNEGVGTTARHAETTVEIPSGGSLVLAGLLQNNVDDRLSGVPWLGDIPVLGALFRSAAFNRRETELVVIATPYVVQPTRPDKLTLPTDGFGSPSDIDLFLLGRLHSRYAGSGKPPPKPGAAAKPFGYILE